MVSNLPPDLGTKIAALCLIVVGMVAYRCYERPPWNGDRMVFVGPGLLGLGVVLLLWPQPAWERHTSDDGAVSVRMPVRPTQLIGSCAKLSNAFLCKWGHPPVTYALVWDSTNVDDAGETPAEGLERLKSTHTENGQRVVSAAVGRLGERPAFDLEVILPDGKNRLRARYVYLGRMIYTAQATAADLAPHEADLNRFFDSFRIDRKPAP